MTRDTACQTELRPSDNREQAHGSIWDVSSLRDCALENVQESTRGQTASAKSEKFHNGCVFFDIKVPESSVCESKRIGKMLFEPPIASVKHCSRNIFQERTSLSPEIWSEGLTCYLGADKNRISSNDVVQGCQRWPTVSRHGSSSKQTDKFVVYTKTITRPGVFHPILLSSGSNTKETHAKTWHKDWILIQMVKKTVMRPRMHQSYPNTSHYRVHGRAEFVFCHHDLRTVKTIQDASCQHFMNMDLEEALQSGFYVELLHSSNGPVLRHDKHLKGRCVLHFCCQRRVEERREIRARVGRTATVQCIHKTEENDAITMKKRSESTENFDNPLMADIPDKNGAEFCDLSLHRREVHVSVNLRKQKRKKIAYLREARIMMPRASERDETEIIPETPRRTSNDDASSNKDGSQIQSSTNADPDGFDVESDQGNLKKMRKRAAFRSSGTKSASFMSSKAPTRSNFQTKKWKSATVSIKFKAQFISNDFELHQSLQDLYTWTRRRLLQEELLKPGDNFVLTSSTGKLSFPLKPNTATRILSSLDCTSFACQEIPKAASVKDTTSKYDIRFSIPMDLRKLEGLKPVQYISQYCSVSSTWRAFYKRVFTAYDKMNKRRLSLKDVGAAMEKLFVELSPALMEKICGLLGFGTGLNAAKASESQSDIAIGPDTFVGICCLANRILCQEDTVGGFHVHTIKQNDTHLEDADFYNIEWKIHEFNLNPLTKQLLLYIRKKYA